MQLTPVQIALTLWSNTQPRDGGDCDCVGGSAKHNTYKKMLKTAATGETYFTIVSTPTPDALVCDRERAWRKYVALRDDKGLS